MKNAFNINIENLINNGIILMNIKEQEIIERYLDEASAADYAKLSTSELKDLLNIFKNVGRSAAKPVLKSIKIELNKRLGEDYAIEEAKVVPFKKLEQAWTRTGGDKAKQAKLIKKHDLKRLISSVRPGEIKLGIKNKLLGTTKAATAAGLDLDDQLIFVTNNPLKIIYPKKSGRRPEGEEIKESNKVKDVSVLRLQKIVSLTINEDNEDILESFISSANIDINTPSSKIREAYKAYKQESLQEGKSVMVKTRTRALKYTYDELLPEVQKIVIMSKVVAKKNRMDVAKKIAKAIIAGKIKNPDISSDLATLIGVDQPYPGAAPRGVVKDQMKKLKLESTELEEADNRLVAHTPAAAKRLIKKLKNKFSGYAWDGRVKGDEIIYPNEPYIKRFIKKQPEVADMKEEVELEEASDKDLDIKSIKALIKKPSPEMIKQYGGKDKYIKMLKSKLAKLESAELEEAFNIDKGAKVAMKMKNDKMLYGKVIKKERVMGKPGVEVKWSNGTKGRFSNDQFAALSMDDKADFKISS